MTRKSSARRHRDAGTSPAGHMVAKLRGMQRCRMSSVLRAVDEATGIAIQIGFAQTAQKCPTHGPITDPIVGMLDGSLAFACPWCSGPAMLAAWQAEGPS